MANAGKKGAQPFADAKALQEWAKSGGAVPKSFHGREDVWNKRVDKYAAGGLLKKAAKALKGTQEVAPAAEHRANLERMLGGGKAPAVIVPSKLSSVKEAVRQSKGDYGARRVERAADEIPNLERMYKEEGLRSAFTGDNAQALMTMNPADFEKYAKGLSARTRADIGPKMAELANKGEIDKYTLPTDEYIKYLRGLPEGFDDVPFLSIDKEEFGLPLKPFISGHEGRHRSRALAASGQPTSLVRLVPRAELREPFPRRTQEEYIQALRNELDLTGNLVMPEGGTGSAIVLPDIYAEGGEVHKADGGKVESKPYIGYRRAGRRPESQQNREASAGIPVAVARGLVSGTLGLPGDIESIARLPYELISGKDSPTILPTSEDIEKRLPLRGASQTPAGQVFTTAGQLAGGAYTGPFSGARAAMAVPRAVVKAGQDFVMAAPQGAPRMFIGPKAKTWDQAKADAAVRMEQEGRDPAEIWRQTGTFRGADGILRQKISDVGAIYRNPADLKELGKQRKQEALDLQQQIKGIPGQKDMFPKALTEARRPAREQVKRLKEEADELGRYSDVRGQSAKFVLEHPELYRAYPELADIKVYQGGRGIGSESAALRGGKRDMEMEVTQKGLRGDPRSSMLHEMQHAVQTVEDMAPGGNTFTAFNNPEAYKILDEIRARAAKPMTYDEYVEQLMQSNPSKNFDEVDQSIVKEGYENYLKRIPKEIAKFDREFQQQAAMEYYRRLAGEAEARATQFREGMTASQRANEFPYASYDVLPEEIIVKPAKKDPFQPELDSFKKGGEVEEKAAFGVFPQMKPRRSRQDREAAARMPVDVARGVVSGVLGAPGDIESIVRMLPGFDEKTTLPTSSDIEKRLPLRSETPTAQFASGLGQLAGGFYTGPGAPLRLAGALPGAVAKAGRDFVQAAGQPAVNVIKPAGGNWLTGSVEKALEPLKIPAQSDADIARTLRRMNVAEEDILARVANFDKSDPNRALNRWIDRNLTNYVKKQMATSDDPVRRLAEEGISHLPEGTPMPRNMSSVWAKREEAGFPKSEGTSRQAQVWEATADNPIGFGTVGKLVNIGLPEPWMEKVDPFTRVHTIVPMQSQSMARDLGFDHIVDVLKQDLDAGRIRPEQLSKVSMEQAVRRTAEFDQEMAKRMREAQIKATEGMPVYREYPEGYRWIELATPESKLPEGFSILPDQANYRNPGNELYTMFDDKGNAVSTGASEAEALRLYKRQEREQILADALKYEGDTMGHCVGGYCPDVMEGRSRIYSLRDAKGEPHVTVEVQKPNWAPRHADVQRYMVAAEEEAKQLPSGYTSQDIEDIAVRMAKENAPPRIVQIKGKQNRAPKEEYLPFVQDFVRSGQWSDVGDLKNTGLQKVGEGSDIPGFEEWMRLKAHGNVPTISPGYYTSQELLQFGEKSGLKDVHPSVYELWRKKLGLDSADGMKAGGEVEMGVGGILRRGAKAAAEPSLPLNLPRAAPKTKEEIRPVAQRMAEQMTGEFVRPNPKKSINPAGKSRERFEMEKGLTHDIRPEKGKKLLPQTQADIEKQLGMLKIGISGDTSIADKVLHRAGPYTLELPSPQRGGPLFALGGEGAWASNNPVAATFQKRVQELSDANQGAPVLGQFVAMGPQGTNFAMHFADANLQAIDLSKMSRSQIDQFNELIRKGSEKSGPRPTFPGIEDKLDAYLAFSVDPELRKYFNALMQKPEYTKPLNLPDGRVILHAITEPEVRDMEILTSGLSQMRLDPSIDPINLTLSAHPTYSHTIPIFPGSPITRTRYPTPAEIEFPDVAAFIKENYRPQDVTRVYQTATPRQMVDPQHIEEIKMYEELMKEYTGKKKGGAVGALSAIEKV